MMKNKSCKFRSGDNIGVKDEISIIIELGSNLGLLYNFELTLMFPIFFPSKLKTRYHYLSVKLKNIGQTNLKQNQKTYNFKN
jgi:hypothetical protein